MDASLLRRSGTPAFPTACCEKDRHLNRPISSREASTRIPFHFIVVDNELLLQHLDGVQFVRLFLFRQHDFTEIALSEYSKEIEIIQPDLPLARRLRLSVLLLLNDLLLLLGRRRLVLLWGWLLILW